MGSGELGVESGAINLKEVRLNITAEIKNRITSFFMLFRLTGAGKDIFVKTFVCQAIVMSPFTKSFSFA